MKKYYLMDEDGYYNHNVLVCEITASDVVEAEKEFFAFINTSGKIYEQSIYKYPRAEDFFRLYFGQDDDWHDDYVMPLKYICTNKNVADRFFELVKNLEYHDKFNQDYCIIERDGKNINVCYGDY